MKTYFILGLMAVCSMIAGCNATGTPVEYANVCDKANDEKRVEVVGFLDDFLPLGARVSEDVHGAPLEVIGTPAMLHEIARRYDVKEVIVIATAVAWETFQNLMQQATAPNSFEMLLSPGTYDILTTSVEVSYRDFVPLLRVNKMRLTGFEALFKAAMDFGLGLLASIILAPVALFLALAIHLTTHEPILESHEVWGVRGSSFITYKFNTRFGRPAATAARPDLAPPLIRWPVSCCAWGLTSCRS